MKNQLLTAASVLLANYIVAQDMIVKKDSSRISATILEIKSGEIKYKLYNYEDGPTIVASKKDLAYVRFRNGMLEIFSEKESMPAHHYDPNKYNLDQEAVPYRPVTTSREVSSIKKEKSRHYEKLYDRKSYLGFNFMSYINGSIGFNYMRDFRKSNLILNIPFSFGFAKPRVTNSLYNLDGETGGSGVTKYQKLNYKGGISLLFSPSLNYNFNFLFGPAISFSEFDMSTNKFYFNYLSGTPGISFSNDFKIYRLHYGIDVGIQARFSEKLNLSCLLTYGYKEDTYSEKDPFGIQYAGEQGHTVHVRENNSPYVTLALSLGYRF
jgi:hypothetical protein